MNRAQTQKLTASSRDLFRSTTNSRLNSSYPGESPRRSKFLRSCPPRPNTKTMELVNRRLEKLIRLCRDPRVVLRNSPPYLLDILPDISDKLKHIMYAYQGSLDELFNSLYFQVFLYNLVEKCEFTLKLFQEAKDKMYDDHSEPRRMLTKYSLILSHILKDLEALFPNDRYAPEAFRITKREAADWWHENFGEASLIPWDLFCNHLFATFGLLKPHEVRELQNTIDLTCNRYISVFEFDVFVRLFQPWTNVLETWRTLTISHAGYMAFMTYDEVKAVLRKFRNSPGPGTYVYRLSCTKLGQWTIGYITGNLRILQTIIQNKSLAQALLDGERDGFYLYPNGELSQSVDLTPLVHNITQTHIQASEEQCQPYWIMGSAFEVCKICTENSKNIRLEPCGHLLCKTCLLSCQNAGNGQTCPFCRLEVKSTEEVVIDPFIRPADDNAARHSFPEVAVQEEEEREREDDDDGERPEMELDRRYRESSDFRYHDNLAENTSGGEENVIISPQRQRDACSCCSRTVCIRANPDEAPSYISKEVQTFVDDTTTFMQRSDVAGVDLEGPPLTTEVARQLLEICDGNADIAARVWRHFIPRP